ncbi:HopJ type III effector protein [Lentisphaera profundi]|uniref:HopJ type III effector protein n=1 Tax=Lentisphaera profundi TaxID=1658616 RepID=A0ABY7VXX3_9BACT|nr:HopJ type III effector protein [Lentisphaera profundi]WDE99111.1 HopJ type III effector protein [Lentisphaera profundi]
MKLQEFLDKVKSRPKKIEFAETIKVIEENYNFKETTFENGELVNVAGENSGSCKVFSFAKMHDLSQDETLALFGIYYRADVLSYPDGCDHPNIRQFMKSGWAGLKYSGEALSAK